MNDSNHAQVVAMLRDALAQVERHGGVGIEICLTTADNVSHYRYYNSDAAQLDAAAMALFDAPCDGGVH